jgi:hypothetical protein
LVFQTVPTVWYFSIGFSNCSDGVVFFVGFSNCSDGVVFFVGF